jgi:hypothetical protein
MATTAETGHWSFIVFRDTLLGAVNDGDESKVRHLIDEFGMRTASAIAAGDSDLVADLRAQGSRLESRVKRLDESPPKVRVITQLQAFSIVLAHGDTALLMRRGADERRRVAGVLRDRIPELLASGPCRPRELMKKLSCDPAQVSRALRQLIEAGVVVSVPAPRGHSDARAHWFGLADAGGLNKNGVGK